MIDVKLTTAEKALVALNITTATGQPAQVDGAPVWSVLTGAEFLGALTASADGLSCEIPSGDAPGYAEVEVRADADLGEGVEAIVEILQFTVTMAKAANLGVTVTVVPK